MRSKLRWLACAGVLSLGPVVAPAAATDDPVQTLKVLPEAATYVDVGIDDAGKATIAWIEGGALMVVTRFDGTKASNRETIASGGVAQASLDVASNGNAVLAFRGAMTSGSLMAAVRTGEELRFGEPQLLAPATDPVRVVDVEARMSEAGRAAVVWQSFAGGRSYDIMGALSDAFGTFGAAETVSSGHHHNPQVAVDSSGRALVIWKGDFIPAPAKVYAATAGATGGFGNVIEVDATDPSAWSEMDVAVNGVGDAVLAYVDVASNPRREKIEVRYGDVGGTFGPSQDIETMAGLGARFEVAIDDAGRAAVLAPLQTAEGGAGFYASISDPNGAFPVGSLQTLSAHDSVQEPTAGEIAAGGGEFTAVWSNDHDEDGADEVWAATSSGGVFGPPHELSGALGSDDPSMVDVARNADGDDVFGWLRVLDVVRAQVAPVAPGPDPIFGSDGADVLDGTDLGESIHAAPGDDLVRGHPGPDDILGEEGDDRLIGGRGGDWLLGGDGDDVLIGGRGKDLFSGGDGHDVCVTTKGDDMDYSTGCEEYRTRKKR